MSDIGPAAEGGHYVGAFVADGWGTAPVKVISITHGFTIKSNEDSTRFAKTVYPQRVSEADFSVVIVFTKRRTSEAFADRMKDYIRKASDPDGQVGAMTVYVPVRSFARIGVPVTGVTYGERVGQLTWMMTIGFVAANDPLSVLQQDQLSRLSDITDTNSIYYPAEVGKEAGVTLYDKPADVVLLHGGPQ